MEQPAPTPATPTTQPPAGPTSTTQQPAGDVVAQPTTTQPADPVTPASGGAGVTPTTPTETETDGESKGISGVLDDITDKVTDVVIDGPIGILNKAAEELAGSAFGDLAEVATDFAGSTTVEIGGLNMTIHMIAAYVAFAAISTSLIITLIRPTVMRQRLTWLTAASLKYALISVFGVAIALALTEASKSLAADAIELTLPDEVDTSEANIYSGALAVVIVPIVAVAFEFQRYLLAFLIAFWPLAAAVSITKSFRQALNVMTALVVANVVWPPIAALAIGQAFAALPNVSAATWWCFAAALTGPLANMIALAARTNR